MYPRRVSSFSQPTGLRQGRSLMKLYVDPVETHFIKIIGWRKTPSNGKLNNFGAVNYERREEGGLSNGPGWMGNIDCSGLNRYPEFDTLFSSRLPSHVLNALFKCNSRRENYFSFYESHYLNVPLFQPNGLTWFSTFYGSEYIGKNSIKMMDFILKHVVPQFFISTPYILYSRITRRRSGKSDTIH